MSDPVRANARRLSRLLVLVGAPVVLVGFVLAGVVTAIAGTIVVGLLVAVVALAAGVATAWWVRERAAGSVLATVPARPVATSEQPRLHNLVEGLCLSHGVPVPDLYVVDDGSVNAMVSGRDQRTTSLVVSSGMLDTLDRIELEGVLAHLLARIRRDDVAVGTVAAMVGRWVPSMPRRTLDTDQVVAADLEACQMTRYPPGLMAALTRIGGVSSVTPAATAATAHLWFAPPRHEPSEAGVPPLHPPLDERIALLREL